ncbi:MAG: wax ester/triacylglycerol synthase family O-acyltransferase [Ilumatobacteraceae bacterium]
MDAAFLAMEQPSAPNHLGSLMIFGPRGGRPLTYETVTDLVAERLVRLPSARRKVAEVPFGLGRPSWTTDRTFDIEYHVRQTALPPGGGEAALARLVGLAHAAPLDRSRPLWELWVIEGLSGQRVALYAKVHVAAIDDTTGAELMTALLDTDTGDDADGAPIVAALEPVDARGNGSPRPFEGLARFTGPLPDQLRWAAGFPGRLADRALRSAGEQWPGMRETAVEVIHRTPGLDAIARMLPTSEAGDIIDEHPTGRAPRLSFNAPVTSSRRFAMATLPIDDVLAVKRGTEDVTFNDVVVAVCAGALRRWLLANDELPTDPTVAMVPILVRGPVDGGNGGRDDAHVAGLVASLPTHVADPVQRLTRTHEALRTAKDRHAAVPASLMQDVSMFAPPAVAAMAGRLVGALPTFVSPRVNLAITNVPGPRRPVHLAGHPLESSHPAMSISDLTPLHIGLQSGADGIGIGAVSCRDTLDDLASLVASTSVELDELVARVAPPRRTRKAPARVAATSG